jgi:hypothetical protein
MDQTRDAKAWRRGFVSGILALALSVAAQAGLARTAAACPMEAAEPGLAEQVIQRLKPAVGTNVAQRVALAVLGAVLHGSNC